METGIEELTVPRLGRRRRWGAVLFTLIETYKLHRINSEAYLKDVLVRIATTPMS